MFIQPEAEKRTTLAIKKNETDLLSGSGPADLRPFWAAENSKL